MASSSSASAAVAEVLRQPDDLVKLAAFRKKLLKEKATLDAKLASGVKSQLEATRDALLKLQASRAAVSLIREEMMAVEKLKGDEEAGEAFDKITRVRVAMIYVLDPNGSVLFAEETFSHNSSIADRIVGIHHPPQLSADRQNGQQPSLNVRQSTVPCDSSTGRPVSAGWPDRTIPQSPTDPFPAPTARGISQ